MIKHPTPLAVLRRPWPLGHAYTAQPCGSARPEPLHVVFIGERYMASLMQLDDGRWGAEHRRRWGDQRVTAVAATPRAAVSRLRHLLPPERLEHAITLLPGDVVRRRRRIWINRQGARRLGVRAGYAYATLLWAASVRRWFAEQIYMDGAYIGGCLSSSGFRLSGGAS